MKSHPVLGKLAFQNRLYSGTHPYGNYINPGYFTLAAIALKPQQIPIFLHISARVWGRR